MNVRFPVFARRGAAAALALAMAWPAAAAQQFVTGPSGSEAFGRRVLVLPNGNFVVADPLFDAGGLQDVGAVHLYRPDGERVASLVGNSAIDRVGSGELRVVGDSNVLACSPDLDRGGAVDVGAASFIHGEHGVEGVVSETNSLVGTRAADRLCSLGIVVLSDGDALVRSPGWDNGTQIDAGAVTFVDGRIGRSGAVSSANSLTAATGFSKVGLFEPVALPNGSYVVLTPEWRSAAGIQCGAATFGSGAGGISGAISAANSLIGSQDGDSVGFFADVLADGDFVVRSPLWDNGAVREAGAATFGSAVGGVSGVVGPGNSLVGASEFDRVSNGGVVTLSSGHYVVLTPEFDAFPAANVGAVTWGSGVSGVSGVVSATNSLLGGGDSDRIGSLGAIALANGNYVVRSPEFRSSAFRGGAATLVSGGGPAIGTVNVDNSLYGASALDRVSERAVVALSNGNYVVASPSWDNGALRDTGAITFGNGTTGIVGPVSAANSLVGEVVDQRFGSAPPIALADGRYALANTQWAPAGGVARGAVIIASGIGGLTGTVSAANAALIGAQDFDQIGSGGLWGLPGGAVAVSSPLWRFGALDAAGAVTVVQPGAGAGVQVSSLNSLHGTQEGDRVGLGGLVTLANGDFLVRNTDWNIRVAFAGAGAITLARTTGTTVGPVTASNSIVIALGAIPTPTRVQTYANGNFVVRNATSAVLGVSDGRVVGVPVPVHGVGNMETLGPNTADFGYDPQRNQLIAGQPQVNRVVLHRTGLATTLSAPSGSPSPSGIGNAVTFAVTVSASNAPTNGLVTLRADTGESCVDMTPEAAGAGAVAFACVLRLSVAGSREIQAEYTGSVDFAYSRSPTSQHPVIDDRVFVDGFEIAVP